MNGPDNKIHRVIVVGSNAFTPEKSSSYGDQILSVFVSMQSLNQNPGPAKC